MPKIRIGFATDINLVNEQVGIGTTNPTARLDVRGQIRADNSAGGGGISTISRYDGFLHSQQGLRHNVSIASTTKGNLNSLSGEIIISSEVTVTEGTSLTGGRLDSLTVTGKFDIPNGGTEEREETPEKGSTRFNEDLGQLEFYTGLEWRTTASYDGSGRGRGVFGGGGAGPSTIDYVNIHTTGNALNFGTLTVSRGDIGGCASSIRGLIGGGGAPALNVIDYITIASEGNAIDFGDLSTQRGDNASCSSSTRGVFGGGYSPTSPAQSVNVIDYVTISTLGNALDFGDLINRIYGTSGFSSPTRGIFVGGSQYTAPGPVTVTSVINLITIASTGNAIKFGDLIGARSSSSCSNSTRGIIAGGFVSNSVSYFKEISYVTISSDGNSVYFGDLSQGRAAAGGVANSTRGVFAGGVFAYPARVNVIEYISIASVGNAQDFGDLTVARTYPASISDSHGGLGGF